MKATPKVVVLLISLFVVAGCATSSPIEKYSETESHFSSGPEIMDHEYPDEDVYRIYHRAATGYVSIETIRQSAERRIDAFADRRGKRPIVLGERTSRPPFVFGNFPRIEIVFALTDIEDGATSAEGRASRYQMLREAQELHQEGILTDEEFEAEKKRILEE